MRRHAALQRVAREVHEGLLAEGHVVGAGLEILRGLDRAHVLRAAHLLRALQVHRHVLLLAAEQDHAAAGTHALAEGDAHLHVAGQVLLEVLGRDHRDVRLLVVCASPPFHAPTDLRRERKLVRRAALAAAGAQHHARGEEHLVHLAAHEGHAEDGDAHLVGVDRHVIDVLHVHDHARLGVVVLGAQLDASGTQVDSRAEGDGDAGLHLHIHLVEGRDALLGDDVRADS